MGDSYTNLIVHLVFATKHREPQLQPPFDAQMHGYQNGITNQRKCTPIAVADLVRELTCVSSGWAHEDRGRPDFAWQNGYGAFSVSQSRVGKVKAYIENQAAHHAVTPFLDEFKAFLRRNNLTYYPDE